LTDAKKMKRNRTINPGKVVEIGYYPCMENILYDLTFCDPLGINISTPPEALHAILKNKLGFNCYHSLQCVNTPVDEDPQPAIIWFVMVVEVGSYLLSLMWVGLRNTMIEFGAVVLIGSICGQNCMGSYDSSGTVLCVRWVLREEEGSSGWIGLA